MKSIHLLLTVMIGGLLSSGLGHELAAQEDAAKEPASQQLKGLGPVGAVTKIQGGFQFLEGPALTPDGSIYFTDIPDNVIQRLRPDGTIERFLEPSAHANGLMYGGEAPAGLPNGRAIGQHRSEDQANQRFGWPVSAEAF